MLVSLISVLKTNMHTVYLLTLYVDLKLYVTRPTNPESPLDTSKWCF